MRSCARRSTSRTICGWQMMPHFMCPGCGHGIALRALLWAVHELRHRQEQARGRFRHRLLGAGRRLYRRQHLPHHPRPAARLRDRAEARPARPDGRRHHRRRRLPGDRRQPPDPRLPAQSRPHLPDAQQRGLRHDRRPGVADDRDRSPHHDDAARQRRADLRRLRARRSGRRELRRARGHAAGAGAQERHQGRRSRTRASRSSRSMSDCTEIYGRKNDLGELPEMILSPEERHAPARRSATAADEPFRPQSPARRNPCRSATGRNTAVSIASAPRPGAP